MNKYAHLAPPKPDVASRRCATKVRYPTQAAADVAAGKIGPKFGNALFSYNCPLCLAWHHTSRAPR